MYAKKLVSCFLSLVFTSTLLAAQQSEHGVVGHGSSRPSAPAHQAPAPAKPAHQKPPRSEKPKEGRKHRRDPRTLDRDTHHRYERRRERDGRVQICFEGYWFASPYQAWPEWVYEEDIYVVMIGPDIYAVYEYSNPAVFVQVVVIE